MTAKTAVNTGAAITSNKKSFNNRNQTHASTVNVAKGTSAPLSSIKLNKSQIDCSSTTSEEDIKSQAEQNQSQIIGAGGIIRRANKPLMEKRRRARINQSLAVLKALILDAANARSAANTTNGGANGGGAKHAKLEKADILELTVRHFQRHRNLDSPDIDKYRAGYSDCAREVARYLSTPEPPPLPAAPCLTDAAARARLLRHLDNCVAEIDRDICPRSNSATTALADLVNIKTEPTSVPNTTAATPPARSIKREHAQPDSSTSSSGNTITNSGTNNQDENNNGQNRLRFTTTPNVEDLIESNEIATTAAAAAAHLNNLSKHQPWGPQLSPLRLPDGQLVLLLPPHYVQLAAALGLNLQQHVAGGCSPVFVPPGAAAVAQDLTQPLLNQATDRCDFERLIELSKKHSFSSAGAGGGDAYEMKTENMDVDDEKQDRRHHNMENQVVPNDMKGEPSQPQDDNMWRPW